ncbi:MAG: nucleotidyltransferase family protein [Alphaproteobacteria bacterium]|nr:nucleotidyltransferase family protein [Alphaproteobacteria bacterium]MBM3732814.1 nucleotidyltransferase family protein [Acidimicrobiia bacterium]
MTALNSAMVLAAGLGTRLRPLTDRLPKPLVPVAGLTLLDHALDRLAAAGVTTAVVNLHHLGDMIAEHLKGRSAPKIILSREERRLETGGGVRHALPLLGAGAFFVVNADVLWLNGPYDALRRLQNDWRESEMDALLLLLETTAAFGYDGAGDFLADPAGRLARRPEREIAPYLFTGVQILHPRLFEDAPAGAFSLNVLYDRALAAGRLYGVVHDGEWFHVGTAEGLAEAEDFLRVRYPGTKRRR